MSRARSLTCCIALLIAPPAAAQSPAEFFRGRTLDFVVGYPPGAGYDAYARLLARRMSAFTPGQPAILVRNMPGASSLKAAQYLAQSAPRDGSTLGFFNSDLLTTAMTEPGLVNIDMGAFGWIGNMASATKTCFSWRDSGIVAADQLREKTLLVGGTSRGSSLVYGSLLRQAYGEARVKIVLGYPSSLDVYLAMERGEVTGMCTGYDIVAQLRPEWIARNRIAFLAQFAEASAPGLDGAPRIHDLPLSEPAKQAARFYISADRVVRPVAAPPGVPFERLAALRAAFDATLADPQFRADAERARMEIQPMNAAELKGVVDAIRATPPEILEIARRLAE